MDKKSSYQVIGTDIFGIKTDYAPAAKSKGYPIQSKYRCCADVYGTPTDLLAGNPMQVSGYGLPQYSDMNKCFKIKKNDVVKINNEIEKNNLNTEELYDSKYKAKKYKKKHADLGENILSYRLVSKKEKNI